MLTRTVEGKTKTLAIPSVLDYYRANPSAVREDFMFQDVAFYRNHFKAYRMTVKKNGWKQKERINKHDRYIFRINCLFQSIKTRLKKDSYKRRGFQLHFSKEEFRQYAIKNRDFQLCYKLWIASGFSKRWTPTVDRIDHNGDYSFGNIRFIPKFENDKDGGAKGRALIGEKDGQKVYFWTVSHAHEVLKVSRAKIDQAIESGLTIQGWAFVFVNKTDLTPEFVSELVIPDFIRKSSYIKIIVVRKIKWIRKRKGQATPNPSVVSSPIHIDTRVFLYG